MKEPTKVQKAIVDNACDEKGKLKRGQANKTIKALVEKGMEPAEARAVVLARTDTYVIKGGGDVVWGVDDTSTLGTITNISYAKNGEYELLLNQQGAVDGVVIYDTKTEVKMTLIAKAAAAMPDIGDNLTVGGVTALVLNTTKSKEYKGLQKFDVTAYTWTNLSLGV